MALRCVFLGFGTRGDVQPVAVLAVAFKRLHPAAVVTLITHSAHQVPPQTQPSAAGGSLLSKKRLPPQAGLPGRQPKQAGTTH
jgi:hypothetical protein